MAIRREHLGSLEGATRQPTGHGPARGISTRGAFLETPKEYRGSFRTQVDSASIMAMMAA